MSLPHLVPGILRRPQAKKPLGWIGAAYDRVFAGREGVLRAIAPVSDPKGFSVAIAHYNRGSRIHVPLLNLIAHPAVREIVILDDGSRASEYRAVEEFVSRMAGKEKVRLHRREKNCGALVTKCEAAALCTSEWVLVLDSDNTAFCHYLNRLHSLEPKNPGTIYGACWAFPFFPFHELAGVRMDFEQAVRGVRSGLLRKAYMINDGNYLVPRTRYVATATRLGTLRSDVADVMLFNYLWLTEGGTIELLPSTAYFHRVDATSFWMRTQEASRQRVIEIFARIESGLPCDSNFLRTLQAEA